MKKVEAIVRPEKLDQIKTALEKKGFSSMTVTDVLGRGEQGGLEFSHRAGKYRVDLLQKTKIEIVAQDSDIDIIIETIMTTARTGEIGDGKIFVFPVEETIRIRTGERCKY
ncbi:MAG: P-II family nitrogen regulator [Methanomassiliicoccales archaeon]|nr:P-II family nitrogen regulator [Methanomassiliicoccales archaeon]